MIFNTFLGISDNSPHFLFGQTILVLGPSYVDAVDLCISDTHLYITVGDSTILEIDIHLQSVKGAIWEARSKWREIGRLLPGVTDGTIDAIHELNDSESLHRVLSVWIQTGKANIHNLLNALKDKTVGRTDIAKTICLRKGKEKTDIGL